MSASSPKASSVCSSSSRACRWVDSLLVAALVAAPMPSNSSEISIAEWRSVPLNSRCSRKCETPACAGGSSREPVRTHRPSATERTDGTASVITRRPPGSSVSLDALGERLSGGAQARDLEAGPSAKHSRAPPAAAATLAPAVQALTLATATVLPPPRGPGSPVPTLSGPPAPCPRPRDRRRAEGRCARAHDPLRRPSRRARRPG